MNAYYYAFMQLLMDIIEAAIRLIAYLNYVWNIYFCPFHGRWEYGS